MTKEATIFESNRVVEYFSAHFQFLIDYSVLTPATTRLSAQQIDNMGRIDRNTSSEGLSVIKMLNFWGNFFTPKFLTLKLKNLLNKNCRL